MMQFQCGLTTYVTENKDNYLPISMSIVFFKPSNLSIRNKIPVALHQIVYIVMTAIPPNLSS